MATRGSKVFYFPQKAPEAKPTNLVEAGNGLLEIIRSAQRTLADHVIPEGITKEQALSDLLALLDGPKWRKARDVWNSSVAEALKTHQIDRRVDSAALIRHFPTHDLVQGWLACDHECMQSVFEAAGGIDGMRRLADAWHRRVMADEVVEHAFSHGFHPEHTERLAAYWAEALGGPAMYSETYGDETSVVRIHSGNGEHDEMDRRAIACFDQALADVGLANDDVLRQVLHDYFAWATTTTMARYHRSADEVPDGLRIPRWSWDGLV